VVAVAAPVQVRADHAKRALCRLEYVSA
jgi:hypothetical protein